MPRTVPALLTALVPFLQGCASEVSSSDAVAQAAAQSAAQSTDEASATIDFKQVADVLLARLDLQPDERVLLVGLPGRFDPLIPLLRTGVEVAGAVDLGAWAVQGSLPDEWSTEFTRSLIGQTPGALVGLLGDVDAGLMLPGASTNHAVYAAMQEVLRGDRGRTIHFHWLGAYNLDGTPRTVDGMVDDFYLRVLNDTDYAALAAAHKAFEDAMRGATVRVTTPAGTDISFGIGDRPVTKQDGNASAVRALELLRGRDGHRRRRNLGRGRSPGAVVDLSTAKRDTSVSRLLGDILQDEMEEQASYQPAIGLYLGQVPDHHRQCGTPVRTHQSEELLTLTVTSLDRGVL